MTETRPEPSPSPPAIVRRPALFEAGFFLILFFGILGGVPARLFQDPGTFWHTKIGIEFLDSGQLPTADTYSFTKRGEPWVCQYWLCDLAMGALYDLGGWDALLVATTLLLAATFAWLAGRLYLAGLDGVIVVFIAFLALAASAPQFHVRPLVWTITFMALEAAVLADVEAGRRPLAWLWTLVPMFVLWVNVHGGVIGGLASLALVAGGWIVFALIRFPSPLRSLRDGVHLAGVCAACGLAVLANPYGLRLPLLWLEILRLPLAEFIIEHAPLTRNPMMALATIGLFAFYLLFLLSTRPKQMRVTWLLPVAWFVLSCQRNRHGAIFAVTVLTILADMLPYCAFGRFLKWREFYYPEPAGDPLAPDRAAIGWLRVGRPIAWALLLGLALGLQLSGARVPLLGAGWAQLDRKHWPVDLLPQLEVLESSDRPVRLFNDDQYGGFLIFYTPDLPVFIDDRCEVYGEAFMRRFMRMAFESSGEFDAGVAEYGLTHALVKRGTALEIRLRKDPEWKLLGESPGAALFARTATPQVIVAP